MALIEKELGLLAVGAVMAVSPEARNVARKGAVYAIAGAMKAGDVVVETAKGAARGAQAGISGSQNGRPTATRRPSPSRARSKTATATRDEDASQAERLAEGLSERVASGVSTAVARAREELEDIWAEAQRIRNGTD